MMACCSGGHSNVLQYLLSEMDGIEFKTNRILDTNHTGHTPLLWAVKKRNVKCIQLLFENISSNQYEMYNFQIFYDITTPRVC